MKLYEICFSPTGGTQKVADILTEALSQDICPVDLTDSKEDFSAFSLGENDVAVLGVPSYGGRVPGPAAQRLSRIRANGAKGILVCVYGNRAYEDTLVELQDIAKQAGFRVVCAVAAVAEHSIARQFASHRPDEQDGVQLRQFAQKIQTKLNEGDFSEPQIPGNRPYKKNSGAGMVPKPTRECVKCGLCAEKCPVQAIDRENPKKVDHKACISCMRCVSVCPYSARNVNGVMLAAANSMLKKACSRRKECELYL
ncbi:MAG TPA: EFR1 family ferrodoxin [Candidatus Acetatifactor stercoripullorum]|uniref:Ferredoxin n=1 Tax=Candidatus Acetatifactor stercoripullorum TaxID=2838414 RepID=A0A9D1UAK1_9FIRM|nr:EFR1 family ferrodoxin [uncultured Acetatifactor sp.]HIW80727.1 EFR1 family ferrodoxin [Candidatus Acetatifactor stercoripullorum]